MTQHVYIKPIHSYDHDHKSPHPYYQLKIKKFENLYLANETRSIDLDVNLGSVVFLFFFFNNPAQSLEKYIANIQSQSPEINHLFDCLFVCLENLAVQPNSEKPGSPNSPTNKKIILSSFEYDLLNKHVTSYDKQMGVHSRFWAARTSIWAARIYISS